MLNLITYFFIYGFLGWILEVVFHAAGFAQWANRGFLNGAICPIYGAGMVLLVMVLEPYQNNPLALFFGSMLLCSALELVTGLVLEKVFKLKWWDYTNEKWNIKGYICLRFSVFWGVGGALAVGLLHRGVSDIVSLIPENALLIAILIMTIVFIVDIIATVINLIGFNKELTSLDEMGEMIKALSDDLTDVIFEESVTARDSYEKRKVEIEDKKKELELLRERFEKKGREIAMRISGNRAKLVRALPDVKILNHEESFEMVKNMLKKMKENKDKDKE